MILKLKLLNNNLEIKKTISSNFDLDKILTFILKLLERFLKLKNI